MDQFLENLIWLKTALYTLSIKSYASGVLGDLEVIFLSKEEEHAAFCQSVAFCLYTALQKLHVGSIFFFLIKSCSFSAFNLLVLCKVLSLMSSWLLIFVISFSDFREVSKKILEMFLSPSVFILLGWQLLVLLSRCCCCSAAMLFMIVYLLSFLFYWSVLECIVLSFGTQVSFIK